MTERCTSKCYSSSNSMVVSIIGLVKVFFHHFRVLAGMGPVSRKSRKLFGSEKPSLKLRPAYSVKLVFSYVLKGIKIKITANVRASRRLRFEDTKRIMSPEMRPKSFGTSEKRALDLTLSQTGWRLGTVYNDGSNAMFNYAIWTFARPIKSRKSNKHVNLNTEIFHYKRQL